MPVKDGSMLNEECTKMIEDICQSLNKAKELYESLPSCIKNEIRTLNGFGETLPYCLNKGITAIECAKKNYGIK
jgi:hypothetical protein